MHFIRWPGLAITLLSSALLAVSSWPAPRHVDAYIDYPKQIRLGDAGAITLSVEPELAGAAGAVAVAQVQATDMRVAPPGDGLQPARPGQPVRWKWQVRADAPGPQRMNVVVYLRQVSKEDGAMSQRPIWARSLAITVTDVFGMPASTARSIALAGAAAGLGLSLVSFARPFLFARKS